MFVLLEAWFADIANGTVVAVNFFNVSVEDAALKIINLLARIYFAEIPEVVKADKLMRCFTHGINIEPTFSSVANGRILLAYSTV